MTPLWRKLEFFGMKNEPQFCLWHTLFQFLLMDHVELYTLSPGYLIFYQTIHHLIKPVNHSSIWETMIINYTRFHSSHLFSSVKLTNEDKKLYLWIVDNFLKPPLNYFWFFLLSFDVKTCLKKINKFKLSRGANSNNFLHEFKVYTPLSCFPKLVKQHV